MIRFGDIIRYERIKLGYTQKEVERLLNMENRGLTHYEHNKHMPKLNIVKKLCDFFMLDFEEMLKLLYGEDFKLSYGSLFRLRREEMGLTQGDVSESLGFSRTVIRRYETDEYVPVKYMSEICELFGFDKEKLIISMNKLDLKTFGGRLRFERLKSYTSLKELEQVLGISDDCLYTYENNTVRPPYKRLRILCEYFDMDLERELDELYPINRDTLGDYLRGVRIRHNFTQVEMSEILNMAENAIINYENNIQKPNYNALRNICKFYNLDFNKVYEEYFGKSINEDSLGTKLKHMRLDKGMLQREVAEILGVSKTTIGNFERGTNIPNEETLNKMYEIYKIEE